MYTRELLQFGEKISMLLLLPPSEDFSSSYWPLVGTKESGLTMPLQIFELGRWSPEKKTEIMKHQLQCFLRCCCVILSGKRTAKCRVVVTFKRHSDDMSTSLCCLHLRSYRTYYCMCIFFNDRTLILNIAWFVFFTIESVDPLIPTSELVLTINKVNFS